MMVATTLLVGVVSLSISLTVSTLIHAREGSIQLSVIGKARNAKQLIVRNIQQGRAVGADSNHFSIVRADFSEAAIRFVDGDNNPDTIQDNRLEYDPDITLGGDQVVLCDHVSPVPGEPMFQVLSTSPRSASMTFHVGERAPPGGEDLLSGDGYQGIEIRLSAHPRNNKGTYN